MSVTTEVPSKALIGGSWVEGSAGTFEVRSPHSREVVNVVTRCDASDVDRAVAAAREAQPGWAAMPLIERVKILRRINQIFLERAEPIARMVSLEIGKTITDSREEVYEYAAPRTRRPEPRCFDTAASRSPRRRSRPTTSAWS